MGKRQKILADTPQYRGVIRVSRARFATTSIAAICLFAYAPLAQASIFDEFIGVRSMAMGGAFRAVGTSNDTVILNPSGMAMQPRYAMDALYAYGAADSISHFQSSAVDSKSGPVSAGIVYTHDRTAGSDDMTRLHRFYLATAYAILPQFAIGLSAKHVRGAYKDLNDARRGVSDFTGDVGLTLAPFPGLSLAVTYQNVVRAKNQALNPRGIGAGIAFTTKIFGVASDALIYTDTSKKLVEVGVGGEIFIAQVAALRAGYRRVPNRRSITGEGSDDEMSAGLGFTDEHGSLDLAYKQSIRIKQDWAIVAAIKVIF